LTKFCDNDHNRQLSISNFSAQFTLDAAAIPISSATLSSASVVAKVTGRSLQGLFLSPQQYLLHFLAI
jgi:hypothetical protein